MSKPIAIIQGSARNDGDTQYFVDLFSEYYASDIFALSGFNIGHFDYQQRNSKDDFLPLATKLITDYDTWLIATPIYWYTISGHVKIFLDRISDLLLEPHKNLGRKLRNKKLAVISVSNGDDCPASFCTPLELSAEYLGMNYLGITHLWKASDNHKEMKAKLIQFSKTIIR